MKKLMIMATAALMVAAVGCKKQEAQKEEAAAQAEAMQAPMTLAQKNLQKGQEFLQANGQRPEVTTTASGLQYEVLEPGKGDNPTADNTVTVHYAGKFIDGTEFDSSYKRGEPATFPLRQVIPGWTEGLQLMQRGAKYRFYIPANLAYGENGFQGAIGPNETLIFDVDLLDFE